MKGGGKTPSCNLCRRVGHATKDCPLRRKTRLCQQCLDMPHHRPRVGLCACRREYQPDTAPKTDPWARDGEQGI